MFELSTETKVLQKYESKKRRLITSSSSSPYQQEVLFEKLFLSLNTYHILCLSPNDVYFVVLKIIHFHESSQFIETNFSSISLS